MSIEARQSGLPGLDRICRVAFDLDLRPMVVADAAGQPLHANPAGLALIRTQRLQPLLASAAADFADGYGGPRWIGAFVVDPQQPEPTSSAIEVIRLAFSEPEASVLLCSVDWRPPALGAARADSAHAHPDAIGSATLLIWSAGPDMRREWNGMPMRGAPGHAPEPEHAWLSHLHAEDGERCMGIYRTCFASKLPFSMDYRLRQADGRYRWYLDSGAPRWDDNGQFLGFVGACVEVHERRLLEDALAERTRQLRVRLAAS